nr:uncharacterized protein LOC126056852 [Helicoverpa armigera]
MKFITFVAIMSWFVMTIEMSTVNRNFNIHKAAYWGDFLFDFPYKVHYSENETLHMFVTISYMLYDSPRMTLHIKAGDNEGEFGIDRNVDTANVFSIKGKLIDNTTKVDISLRFDKKKYCIWRLFDGTRSIRRDEPAENRLNICTETQPCSAVIILDDECTWANDKFGIVTDNSTMTNNSTMMVNSTMTNNTTVKTGVLSGVALIVTIIVIVVIATIINKRKTPQTQVPTPATPPEPFYLNNLNLFRKECDRAIEALEEHQYEEIN